MHTLTWLVWLVSALIVAGLTNNPLYLALVLLATMLVFLVWREPTPLARTYRLFLGVGFVLWLGYTLFGIVTVGGARGQTVLLALPELRLPVLLGGITFGGLVTVEDLVWGAIRGLRIWTLIAIFGAFNALIDHYRLLRLTPRSLFHAGLAVTIAITFVPQLVQAISQITEAQRVRGHRFRGPVSYLPLVGPLLAGSLESSIQLAESLDARGFGRTRVETSNTAERVGVLLGVLLLGLGTFQWLYAGAGILGGSLLLAGSGLLLVALRALGRRVSRTTYRRERWRRRDSVAAVAAAAGAALWAALRLWSASGQVYNPYPVITPPPVSAAAALLVLALAVPALLRPRVAERGPRSRVPRRRPGS